VAEAGSLFVRIAARTKELKKGLDDARSEIDAFANRASVAGAFLKNSLISLAPALSPATAAVAGLGGAALSSFGAAGAGAVAFGALAVTSIGKVNQESEKLKALQDQLDNTKGAKERAKIMQQISKIQNGMTKQQKEYLKTVKELGSFWSGFAKQFENQILGIAINGMKTLQTMIKELKPAFAGAVSAVDILSKSLRNSMNSEPMQKFFDYMNRMAGPTLLQLGQSIGYAIQGILNLMVAFEPLAKQFNGGFLSMMKSFAEWSAGLQTNQGFQQFVAYVQQNGPVLLSIIGQFATLIMNVLTAFAPLGATMLPVILSILQFTNGLIAANPQAAAIIFILMRLSSTIGLLLPVIKLLKIETLKTVATTIWGWTTKAASVAANAARMIASMVATVAKYTWMGITMVAKAVWWTAKTTATIIVWAAKQTATMIAATAKMVARMAWASAQFVAKYAWMAAKALFHAARMAASWFIALGPVGWVIGIIIGLVALIIANWDKVSAWTSKTWNKLVGYVKAGGKQVWNFIKDTFNKVVGYLTGLGGTFLNAGKGLIEQMAKGIEAAAGKVISKVKNLANKVRDFLPFSPAKTGPLSDIDKLDFGGPIGKSIAKAVPRVQTSMNHMMQLPNYQKQYSGQAERPSVVRSDSTGGNVTVAQLVVREEADIDRIADKLHQKQRRTARSKGVVRI
jgi:hypothetical protein